MEHVFRLVEETLLGFTKKWNGGGAVIDDEEAFKNSCSVTWQSDVRQLSRKDD